MSNAYLPSTAQQCASVAVSCMSHRNFLANLGARISGLLAILLVVISPASAQSLLPTLTVLPASLTVTEGGTGEYTLQLDAMMPEGHTLQISPRISTSDDGYAVTLDPALVTFSGAEISKIVTITVINDDKDLDNKVFEIGHSYVLLGGADAEDNVLPGPLTVTLTITDNDERGLIIRPTRLEVTEGGSVDFEVSLSSQPTTPDAVLFFVRIEPPLRELGGDIIFGFTSPGTERSEAGETHFLDFDASNPGDASNPWNVTQTVRLHTSDNNVDEGDRTLTLRIETAYLIEGTEEGTGDYDGIPVPEVELFIIEDDEVGISVELQGGRPSELQEPGRLSVGTNDQVVLELRLESEPTGPVTVRPGVEASGKEFDFNVVIADGNPLIFTPPMIDPDTNGNYASTQPVALTSAG